MGEKETEMEKVDDPMVLDRLTFSFPFSSPNLGSEHSLTGGTLDAIDRITCTMNKQ